MKTLALIFLAMPWLTGCLATGNLMQLGRKSEFKFRVDEVRRSTSGPSYLVEYTATVGLSTIGGGNSDQKRYQILTPGEPPPPRLVTKPANFGQAHLVPLKRVASSPYSGGLGPGQSYLAILVEKEHLILLGRNGPRGEVVRTDFTFTTLDYREPYSYPVMALGLPVAFAFDTVVLKRWK